MSASSSERLWAVLVLFVASAGCVFELGPEGPDAGLMRACQNGLDDDGDGRADFPDDPGCESEIDPAESDPLEPRACSDGVDNDADGRIDYDLHGDGVLGAEDDPGCSSAADDDERNVALPSCADGVDNDGDGLIDFPLDPGCTSRNDASEEP